MRFKVQPIQNPNERKYAKEEIDLALKFSRSLVKEFESFVKCVVLFGSLTRKKSAKGDIDILIVVDDISLILSPDLIATYRLIVDKIVEDISPKLHITTLKFSSFWEYCRAGDPIVINILRDGVPILDAGFFHPMQFLLRQGRIRPTVESTWSYFVRAPATMHNSKWHLLQASLDLYWAVIDAAHAALMKVHVVPPSPEHVSEMLNEKLVKPGKIEFKYVEIMRRFYKLSRLITHREIKEISGHEYDKNYKEAFDFVNRMKDFIEGKK